MTGSAGRLQRPAVRRASQQRIAALLLALAAATRLFGLADYPAVNPDEGFWLSGPRNLVRFGDALMDGRLHPFLSPLHFAGLAGWFTLFPETLVSARWFSAALGTCTCALLIREAQRWRPEHPWLGPAIVGLSATPVVLQRVALLEAHQMFWISLAVVFWLREGRRAAAAAGWCLGCAVLVKSNAVFLLGAFLLSTPDRRTADGRPDRTAGATCLVIACGVAALGYLAAQRMNPHAFASAFAYELDGQNVPHTGVLFSFGRFGFNPAATGRVLLDLLTLDPLVMIAGVIGGAATLRRWASASRADRFLTVCLLTGFVFHLGQIAPQLRYLGSLAPMLAVLAARTYVDVLAKYPRPRGRAVLLAALVVALTVGSAGRVALGLRTRPNATYWSAVAQLRATVPRHETVLGSASLVSSLPHQGYDFFRLVFPYGSAAPRRLADVVREHGVDVIVTDAEWRQYETPEMHQFISAACRPLLTGDVAACRPLPTGLRPTP